MLPSELWLNIFSFCDLLDLVRLCSTCHLFYSLISLHSWQSYVAANPRPTLSLAFPSAHSHVRHNHLSDKAWGSLPNKFYACTLGSPWKGRYQSSLAINDSFLVFAAASSLHVHRFVDGKRVEYINTLSIPGPAVGRRAGEGSPIIITDDITSIVFSRGNTLIIGRQYGSIESMDLAASVNSSPDPSESLPSPLRMGGFNLHPSSGIERLSASLDLLVSVSSNGMATLYTPSASSEINMETRSWTSYIPPSNPSFAVFGTTSRFPIVMHSITSEGFSSTPFAVLHYDSYVERTDRSSAAYALSHGPPHSPWGSSPHIVASGWYDGVVRVYDLRTPSADYASLRSSRVPLHLPVLVMWDPWSSEPIYSLGLGGGGGAHIAAGQARHSVVAFWDVRKVMSSHKRRCGWSAYAPGSDSSPVYDLKLEGSRVWGATEKRGFVFDFGPDVARRTYSSSFTKRGKKGWPGDYVTIYHHATGATT